MITLPYLFNHFKRDNISLTGIVIVVYTFVLYFFLVGVNHLMRGNYGILLDIPFLDK
ncbi:hypothetical protein STRCR_1109 [Streptococcus criceti HS-6]|uniref:Uncharacterized protein n=1 Tax=Streptococcus criceti HS-6 TaxID=873449 RepID=G5JTL2_STRCG|nr:hypothetical protein STRCR_1109 [Streptococcus criceti HS-6]